MSGVTINESQISASSSSNEGMIGQKNIHAKDSRFAPNRWWVLHGGMGSKIRGSHRNQVHIPKMREDSLIHWHDRKRRRLLADNTPFSQKASAAVEACNFVDGQSAYEALKRQPRFDGPQTYHQSFKRLKSGIVANERTAGLVKYFLRKSKQDDCTSPLLVDGP